MTEVFTMLIVVMVTRLQHLTFVKTYRTVDLTEVNLTLYKLYLNLKKDSTAYQ